MTPAASSLRASNVARLSADVYDVLTIGAGINGAVSAAALAARGASVALVDRADFACLTSQESSNLIWGGIKYLENLEFPLVRTLCRSRNALIRSYPTNVREIRFYTPVDKRSKGFTRTVPALYAGAWLYWLMGGAFTRRPRWLSLSRIAAEEPCVNTAIMKGGIEYSDAYLVDNDARFVFGFVRTALNHGAAVANYVDVKHSARDDSGSWNTTAVDRVTGCRVAIRSRVLLNTTGPYVDSLNVQHGVQTRVHHLFSKGIHIVVDRVTRGSRVLTFFDDTDRMFFVIPMGHRSVIGTTDTRVGRPESVVTDEDRRFLFDNINTRLTLSRPLGPGDIIAERCGVRPLVVEGAADTEGTEWLALSRKHVIDVERGLRHISVFGGKLSDCLNVGEEVAALVRGFGIELRQPTARWYGEPSSALHAAFTAEAQRLRLDQRTDEPTYEALSDRLWRRYGTGAFGLLEDIGRHPDAAAPIIEGTEYRRCELEFAARSEMIVTLEDFLRRRTKIAQIMRRPDLRKADGLLRACEILFGAAARERYDEYFAGHVDPALRSKHVAELGAS